jgi:surfeit locus 1 family protein
MSRRALTFLALAIIVAAGCVRLGFWQLHRLSDRRALNARLASRLSEKPVPARDLVRDTASAIYRRSSAEGTYDFANEIALAARTREGSPGVNILTPLKLAGTDSAILVNRGWVYAADAMTVDFARWNEESSSKVTGYLLTIPVVGAGAVNASTNPRLVRRLQYDSLAKRFPYPIARMILVATEAAAPQGTRMVKDSTPARLPAPLMDEGPHLGYAVQWFSFAVIALVGAGVAVRADRRPAAQEGKPSDRIAGDNRRTAEP